MQSIHKALLILIGLGLGNAAVADEACLDFKWDVSKERALFAGTPVSLVAGKDPTSAPAVVPNRLYKLQLTGQSQVVFSASPAKSTAAAAAYAGLATLTVSAPGSYRIAVDLPLWIDVVSNGARVAAKDFQGQHDCSAPHKIVEFDLTGVKPFVLQMSNADKDSVLFTVTPSPPRKL